MKYVCLFATIFGIAGAFNSIFVVMELRIPPENLGSASVLMFVISALGCSMTPSIAIMEDPTRMLMISAIIAIGFVWTYVLPTPGKFLPKAVKLNENVTLLQYDNMSLAINDSLMMPFNAMTASFQ